MKRIVCELCEGTEFIKENGMFICQGCGTKYSTEEARSMMQEVEGDAPAFAGIPVVGTPIGNPNQVQIDNILILATTAYEAQNYAEAENYCNRAIELDAMCYKAWNLKGKAVGWQSKIDNLRIEEASHSFCKAIDFAPDEEKEGLKEQAVEELKKLGLALISLRKQRFGGKPDSAELNGFNSDKKTILGALLVLLSHGNAVDMPEGYLEEVAKLMNEAGVAALNMARMAWADVEHPSQKDLSTYLDWNDNICEVFRQAIKTSDNDDEEDIDRYRNLIIALKDPIGRKSQTRKWNSFREKYDWVDEYSLNETAKQARNNEVTRCETKIKELEKKVADKKAARIEAYWEAHADEKATLEAEKNQLIEKKATLDSKIAELDKTIQVTKDKEKAKAPSEEEIDKLKDRIRDLEYRRGSLSIFAGKEKKQISEEIVSLQGRIDSLKSRIDEEKKAKAAEIQKELEPVQSERDELNSERSVLIKRISAIDAELTKDPEE